MFKIGDTLICKEDWSNYYGEAYHNGLEYTIIKIFESKSLFTFDNNNIAILSEVEEHFYSKQEIRKLKLKAIENGK